jgi:hypothetical protein
MKCLQAKSLFSPYLDGAVTGKQMQDIGRHLSGCPACNRDYVSLREVQQVLGKLGPRKAPADLALRLRLAISHEAARQRQAYWPGIVVRFENALNAFMVPAMAGLTAAVVIFGVLMGFVTLPLRGGSDVPLGLYTAPQLQQSAFGMSIDSIHDDSLVIEAEVDSNGRVRDYRVLSNPKDLTPQVKNMLIFTTFRPATSMGVPTAGRAVLSYSKISVKG